MIAIVSEEDSSNVGGQVQHRRSSGDILKGCALKGVEAFKLRIYAASGLRYLDGMDLAVSCAPEREGLSFFKPNIQVHWMAIVTPPLKQDPLDRLSEAPLDLAIRMHRGSEHLSTGERPLRLRKSYLRAAEWSLCGQIQPVNRYYYGSQR